MLFRILLSLFLSFFLALVQADVEPDFDQEQVGGLNFQSDNEGLLSTVVANHVEVISGEYVDQTIDCALTGPEPFIWQRQFSSNPAMTMFGVECTVPDDRYYQVGGRHCAWHFNHFKTLLYHTADSEPKSKKFEIRLLVPNLSGNLLLYSKTLMTNRIDKRIVTVPLKSLNGMSNCSTGCLSGQTSPKNTKVILDDKEHYCQVLYGNGHESHYAASTFAYIQLHRFHLLKEFLNYRQRMPSGNIVHYDKKGVNLSDPTEKTNFGWFDFIRFNDKHYRLATSHGPTIDYKFKLQRVKFEDKNDLRGPYFLYSVKGGENPDEHYSYTQQSSLRTMLVRSKKLPDNRFTTFEYYKKGDYPAPEGFYNASKISHGKDPRLNRIKRVWAPVGTDEKPIVTHRLFYDIYLTHNSNHRKYEIHNGKTIVLDALNRKKVFKYDFLQHVTKISTYNGDQRYHVVRYLWDYPLNMAYYLYDMLTTKDTHGYAKLMGKIVEDGEGRVLKGRYFEYDDRGNILTETVYGNLTGEAEPYFSLDQNLMPVGPVESVFKKCRYSSDGFNLLLEEKDEKGKKIKYRYVPHTNLLKSKIVSFEGENLIREFYEYDSNNCVTRYCIDDGKGKKVDDLTGVTERRITYNYPRTSIPVGVLERVEEYVLDRELGQEILVKKMVQDFTPSGKLLARHVYDANDEYCYTLNWEYDSKGNVILETDPLGQVTHRSYDRNNNLILEKGPDARYETRHYYDFSNRKICTQEVHADGQIFSTHYKYDYVGNCISFVDRYGNETLYTYDDLNRLVQTTYPLLETKEGVIAPVTRKEYDFVGNVTKEVDAKGQAVTKTYTATGKVTSVETPDGQIQRFIYHKNGVLARLIHANGNYTLYTTDPLNRLTAEQLYSPEGELIHEITHTYNSFRRLSTTDTTGLTTTFTYYPDGQLRSTMSLEKNEEYAYDSLGRLVTKVEAIDTKQKKISRYIYDLLDRVLVEAIEDEHNVVHRQVTFTYDVRGNKTSKTEISAAGKIENQVRISVDQTPYLTIDPQGNETHITYDYQFKNALGQWVLQTTTTDSLGRQTLTTYDAHNNIVEIQNRDSMGIVLSMQEMRYDPVGNLTHLIDHVIINGETKQSIETEMFYDSMDQVTCLIQSKGKPEQLITHTYYDAYSQKSQVLKSDGTTLNYTYDQLGRLVHSYSNRGTIDYTYSYNQRNQLVQAVDNLKNQLSQLSYDVYGRTTSETLANGLTLCYSYDLLDRITTVTLPDNSRIDYSHNASHLKTIRRIKDQACLYFHNYTTFDQAGLNLTMENSFGQKQQIRYDQSKRPIEWLSTHFNQTDITYDAGNRLVALKTGTEACTYAYDDLNHLVEETGPLSRTYTSDSLHNRLSKEEIPHTYNGLNQLLDDGEYTYTYDARGNLIEKKGKQSSERYSYDDWDRLTAVNENEAIYTYDVFNRRQTKTVDGKQIKFLYQGQNEIGAIDAEGKIIELRVLGLGIGAEIGAAVALEINDRVYLPTHDIQGNVVALSDTKGKLVESYRYTTFGERKTYNGSGKEIKVSAIGNPWLFSSKRFDEESGHYYFGRRFYDPQNGRWTTLDPIGLSDGTNLYAYLHHQPVLANDLYGLSRDAGDDWGYFPLKDVDSRNNDVKVQTKVEDVSINVDSDKANKKKCKYRSDVYYCGFKNIFNYAISFTNGIMNSAQDAYESAKMISDMAGGCFVTFVHNASTDVFTALIRCSLELYFHVNTKAVITLELELRRLLENTSEWFKTLQNCHSEGVIIMRNALRRLEPALRNKIIVAAYCPGGYIDSDLAYQVTHYVSNRDLVPWLDIFGRIRCRDTIVVLEAHKDAPLFDHSFSSPTFSKSIEKEIRDYLKTDWSKK